MLLLKAMSDSEFSKFHDWDFERCLKRKIELEKKL